MAALSVTDAPPQLRPLNIMRDLPAVSAAWDSGELAEDPQLSVFGDQLDNALAPPAVPTWEEVATVIDGEVEKATKGDTSVEDAVAEMQRQAAQIGTGL